MKKLLYVILCVMMLCVCLSIVGCESVTPQLRINSETLYWEVSYDNGATWESLDVKAVGENGTNGENGTDGVDGTDGTDISIGENGNWFIDGVDTGKPATSRIDAPKFRINDDTFYWEVSYDDGETWESLDVVAIGEDGTKVTIGPNDNWFIDGVDTGRLAFDFEAKFRFLVASDVHMQENGAEQSLVRFEKLIDSAYAYSASNKNYKNLDGMFFCGDLTQDGRDAENQLFWNTLNAKTKEGTTSRAVLGNHDFRVAVPGNAWGDYVADSITARRFEEEWAKYPADSRIEIGGYQFIFLSMDNYDKDNGVYYREGRRAWLKTELDNAVAADPTGQKPIFVFNHMGPRGTAAGTEGMAADLNLHNILKDYPNVVDFSGHVHVDQINPNSVWQGDYTAIAVGSMTGTKIPLNGDPTRTAVSQTLTGDMAWICELDDANKMRLVCFDYLRGEVYRTYYLDSFGNPDGFDYTTDREIITDVPKFDRKADVTVVSNNYKKVDIKFPQAKSDNLVTTYVVDVLNSSDEIIKTEYVLSGAHLGSDQPKELKLSLGGLEQNTTYTINVCAYNFYDEKSLPLSVTFTTTAKPTGDIITPDVMSIQFNTDGTVKDTVTNTALEMIGTTPATIAFDETLNANVATFAKSGKTGASGYRFDAYADWQPILKNEFTMEINLSPGFVPADGAHIKPMGAIQGGGMGFQYTMSKKLQFLYYHGSTDTRISVTIEKNEWAHVVVTFDGSYLKIYKNGELVQTSSEITGTFKAPSSNYFAVGCDSNTAGTVDSGFIGKISTANIYSDCLTDSQVATIYAPFAQTGTPTT